jgi:hypothetical protein
VYSGVCSTMYEALSRFAQARSAKEKGVTQPSQRRLVIVIVLLLLLLLLLDS